LSPPFRKLTVPYGMKICNGMAPNGWRLVTALEGEEMLKKDAG
jgi:hypothetical protein